MKQLGNYENTEKHIVHHKEKSPSKFYNSIEQQGSIL